MKRLLKNKKILIVSLAIAFVLFENLMLMIRYSRLSSGSAYDFGVSFSQVQAERYGSNWKENYLAILDDLQFKKLRIPAYWDRLEPQKGQYDFSETDWMIDEAKKRNAKVTLVVGQKSIRYPECFYPAWLDRNDTQEVATNANAMIAAVAKRYKDNPTVASWQLENEFLLKTFGQCPSQNLTNKALAKELETLRSVDSSRPIVLTQSDQFGFPIFGPLSDTTGFSMYRTVWNNKLGYFRYPQSGHFFWWKAAIMNLLYGQKVKVHELQAEAWGPNGNEYISHDESQKSMDPKKFMENIEYAKQTRIKDVDLWGAEWWYHQKHTGNPQMWNAVREFVAKG